MKSPFTGGDAELKREYQKLTYRGKEYKFVYTYYECVDTKEQFTTTELDEVNMGQVYNQYRTENGIPFPDEIKELRKRFNLSAKTMSMLLGFGENQYRLYENGEVPSLSNGRAIRAIINSPSVLRGYLDAARGTMQEGEYKKYAQKIENAILHQQAEPAFINWVFSGKQRGAYNGYAKQSPDVLKNVILYFIAQFNGVFRTQLNKLLFYTDFLAYRTLGTAITGLQYTAIQFGPVPIRWDRVYSAFNEIYPYPTDTGNGNIHNKLVSTSSCDTSIFTKEQLNVLQEVAQKFSGLSSTEISNISHLEDAWKENKDNGNIISFDYAFRLLAI